MKVAIIGSRTFTDYLKFETQLKKCLLENNLTITQVISGGAEGVDTMARKYAKDNKINLLEIKPQYNKYKQDEKRKAPLDRNLDIAKECDIMIAFIQNNSSGSLHAVSCALKLNKKVYKFEF